jgi:hypothetical protein
MLLRMQLRTKDHDGNRLSIVKTFTAVPSKAVLWNEWTALEGLGRPSYGASQSSPFVTIYFGSSVIATQNGAAGLCSSVLA